MSLQDAMRDIQGSRFAAQVSLASDIEMFGEALQAEVSVNELLVCLADTEARNKVFVTVQALVYERTDIRYRNPRDVAIAAYVWALGAVDPTLGTLAAVTVEGAAARCWWARKMARLVLQGSVVPNQTETTFTIWDVGVGSSATITSSPSEGDVIFVVGTDFDLFRTGTIIGASSVGVPSESQQLRQAWTPPELLWPTSSLSSGAARA